METENFIYALRDPRTDEIRYIGFSSRGMTRPNEHFLPGHYNGEKRKHYPLYKWMRKMIGLGLVPRLEILEYCATAEELPELERILVALHKEAGARLLNCTEGGDGTFGYKLTPEQSARASASRTGRKASDEHKAAISAGLVGKSKSPEHVAAMSAVRMGKTLPPETRKQLSIARQAYWDSPEGELAKKAMSEKMKNRKPPEERVERMTESLKGRKQSPEHIAAKAAAQRAFYAGTTPEERSANAPWTGKTLSEEHKAKLRVAQTGRKYAEPVTKKCDLPGCETVVKLKTNKFCSIGCYYTHKRMVQDGTLPPSNPSTQSASASVIVRRPKKV